MCKKVGKIESTAIQSLVNVFGGEDVLTRAAFSHSYFICPDEVRNKTPYYPDRARYSREHYPGKKKNDQATWKGSTERTVTLDDNSHAQKAWEKYTGSRIKRKSGYGVRHIWGDPWNPDAFTAGWNLCYMPFWAGMLTEKQHPLEILQKAIRQTSWDLYFADNPVYEIPDFVTNPEFNLNDVLQGQEILILSSCREQASSSLRFDSLEEALLDIRKRANQSWSNLYKATRLLQDKEYEDFGTSNVENSSKSTVRRILKSAQHDCCAKNLKELESLIEKKIGGHQISNHATRVT